MPAWPYSSGRPSPSSCRSQDSGNARRALVAAVVLAACAYQFHALRWDPGTWIPNRASLQGGRALVEAIRSVDGDVFLIGHGFMPTLAGKKTFAQAMWIEEVLKNDPTGARDVLEREIVSAITARRSAL